MVVSSSMLLRKTIALQQPPRHFYEVANRIKNAVNIIFDQCPNP
jgi:hypothetical protein